MRGKLGRRLARILARDTIQFQAGKGAVAITFDDVPRSACDVGSRIVTDTGGLATYYVSGSFERSDTPEKFHTADDLLRLHAQGHEIGCHGFGHLNYQTLSRDGMSRDIADNQAYFQQIGLPPARSFAYPYGCVSPAVKSCCGDHYKVSRGITQGINTGTVDARLLKAIPLYAGTWSAADSRQVLQQTAAHGGLVVFFTHGVVPDPGPFDCTPDLLRQTMTAAQDLGLAVLPLWQAINQLRSAG